MIFYEMGGGEKIPSNVWIISENSITHQTYKGQKGVNHLCKRVECLQITFVLRRKVEKVKIHKASNWTRWCPEETKIIRANYKFIMDNRLFRCIIHYDREGTLGAGYGIISGQCCKTRKNRFWSGFIFTQKQSVMSRNHNSESKWWLDENLTLQLISTRDSVC